MHSFPHALHSVLTIIAMAAPLHMQLILMIAKASMLVSEAAIVWIHTILSTNLKLQWRILGMVSAEMVLWATIVMIMLLISFGLSINMVSKKEQTLSGAGPQRHLASHLYPGFTNTDCLDYWDTIASSLTRSLEGPKHQSDPIPSLAIGCWILVLLSSLILSIQMVWLINLHINSTQKSCRDSHRQDASLHVFFS